MDVVIAVIAGTAMLVLVGWIFYKGLFADERPRR